jgi:hypothetical protein
MMTKTADNIGTDDGNVLVVNTQASKKGLS